MLSSGEERCTCSASLCRHELGGCLNSPLVEVTVSAKRSSESHAQSNTNFLCEKCWAFLQINLPTILGFEKSQRYETDKKES
jgi:hypothetical protein